MLSTRTTRIVLSCLLSAIAGTVSADQATPAAWQKIDVPAAVYKVTDGNGAERDIAPSCSGGPVCKVDPTTGQPQCREGNKQFSFYFKPGKTQKLLVFFDGGGACWDSNTCVTSALTPLPAYVPEIGPKSDPANSGGVFNLANKDNPYRDWSMAFIPYCTGDIHWGSKDDAYTDYTGAITGTPGGQVTIHHRGFDNFLYVRQWLKGRFSRNTGKTAASGPASTVEKLLVTGSSAGAYGAVFGFPHLQQAFPGARGYLLADAGNGVVTDSFLQQAVQTVDASWGMAGNLAHWVPGMDSTAVLPADRYIDAYYFALAGYYPKDRFSQYTTHWDVVQALFYNIMLNQNDIQAWGQITPSVLGDWVGQMVNHISVTAANPNYRFYVGAGCNHTALRFNDDFYGSSSTQAIPFLSWFKALTKDDDEVSALAWQNTFCDSCSAPPTQQEATACMQRSFGG